MYLLTGLEGPTLLNLAAVTLMGALAGLTIFIGLPVARMRGFSRRVQGFFNAVASGILIFLLWDVLSKAQEPVIKALAETHKGRLTDFGLLVTVFVGGIAVGLMSLVYFNARLQAQAVRSAVQPARGPGAAVISELAALPTSRWLAISIAIGLGLHNLSEGLAIGQSAASGALAFAAVLVIGFGLHNITEGFGIAAPLASDSTPPSWGFLLMAGLLAGGPTFLGTLIGYGYTSVYLFVFFLTLAAGALIYVINEMHHVGRKMNSPAALGWGILLGFSAGYGTDLLLTFAGR